eukprot:12771764-Alexandrium_andersonii.AAC.1
MKACLNTISAAIRAEVASMADEDGETPEWVEYDVIARLLDAELREERWRRRKRRRLHTVLVNE